MDRRHFLGGAVALIASASASSLLPAAHGGETNQERFERLAATGLIEGERFDTIANGQIVIESLRDFEIRNCHFVFAASSPAIVVSGEMARVSIIECSFERIIDMFDWDASVIDIEPAL